MDTLSSTKEARIYNGLKTISLTSGVGKTGQPLVKERMTFKINNTYLASLYDRTCSAFCTNTPDNSRREI